MTDIAAMHRKVAAGDDLLDPGIQIAMGVGQERDPNLRGYPVQSQVNTSLPVR